MSSSSRKNNQLTENKAVTSKESSPNWRKGLLRGSAAEPLEPRVMLDAAGVDAANDALDTPVDSEQSSPENRAAQHNDNNVLSSSDPDVANIAGILASLPVDNNNDAVDSTLDDGATEQRQELVLVDTTVEDYQQLLADLLDQSGAELPDSIEPGSVLFTTSTADKVITIVALDTSLSGIDAISTALGNQQNLDAVHVLSHGDQGALKIGSDTINQQTVLQNTESVAQWQTAFNVGADFLLYGCYTGDDATGVAFVNSLALQTGADVAASTDPTGHASAGGDWQLEVAVGSIETELVTGALAQSQFQGVLAASPTATVDTPATSFVNEPFEFCVLFENTGADAGYEPYLDVFIEPGVVVNGASYLGAPLDTSNLFTWNGSAWIDAGGAPLSEHPLSPAIPLPGSPGTVGTTWIMLDMPFGSFVLGQPPAKVAFDAVLDPASGAVVGDGINITAQAGFELGEDPFDNPDTDGPIIGPLATGTTTPNIWEIEKLAISDGDNAVEAEDEQGTGPNNPITYEIRVDIADGQTVDNIVLSDLVPNNIHYLGSLTVAGSGAQVNLATSDAAIGVHNGNQLSVSFDSVTGTLGDDDIIINFDGYIPDLDANGVPILGPANGQASGPVINEVVGDGEYGGANISATDEYEIDPKSVAIQKSNIILDSAGNPVTRDTVIPGDFVEWTLVAQISDYMSLDEFIIDDQFTDGQLYVAGSATLAYTNNGVYTAPSAIAAGDVTLNAIDPADGSTLVTFDVANAIGGTGQLDGDLANDSTLTTKTRLEVKFRTQIQETFQFPTVYGGNASVDVGDILTNDVVINAEVVGTGSPVSDNSSSSVSVSIPVASKSIYAIHEDTDNWDIADPEIAPGQSITYRITVELPTSDVENLVITDFMPLPVFAVHPNYDYTGFYSGVDNVPAPGQFGFGPLTNVGDFPPGFFDSTGTSLDIANVTTDAATNTIVWDFDSFSQVNSSGGVIDLLFTTATANVPFEDGLTLTNQTQVGYDNTNNPQDPIASIVQIEPLAPELSLTKGVVAVDSASTGTFDAATVGPVAFNDAGTAGAAFAGAITSSGIAATPIDSDLSGVDAGDTVRFAITIENAGGFQATDITVNDDFPAGFVVPPGGLNMQAALGDGTALSVVGSLFDASGNPDVNGVSFNSGASDVLLGAGRIDTAIVDDGSNIIVLTYDLLLDTSVAAASVLTNTAEILTFAAEDGLVDYTDGNTDDAWSDDATVESVGPSINKELVSSGIDNADNAANRAVPGEYITYRVTIDLPEGSHPVAEIRDLLDNGLKFDSLISVTPSSADVSTDLAGGFAGVVAPASGSTGRLVFDLGNITNANTDNAVAESLVLEYRVYAAGTTTDGQRLNNRADFRWDNDGDGNNAGDGLVRDRAPNVTIITPKLDVAKTILGTPPTDVGDLITYQIVVSHEAASDTDAFNVSFSDIIPPEISGVSIVSVVDGGIGAAAGFTLSGNTVSNSDFDLALGESIVITVSGTVANALTGAAIINTADIDWTTLDDTDPGDGVDAEEPTYSDTDDVEFTVAPPVLTKSIISTGIDTANNSNTDVVQGEYVVYRVVVEVPEGTTAVAEVVDTLPANMTFDTSYTPTVTLSNSNLAIGSPGVPPTLSGQDISFALGTIVNSGNDNAVIETISIDYRVYVSGGVTGDMLTNSAELRWDVDGDGSNTGGTDGSQIDTTTVDVLVPVLEVDKQVTTVPADAGDAIEYTIVISHNAASNTDAYDATFSDLIPSEISGVTVVSASDSASNPVSGFVASGNTITNTDFDLVLNDTITLVVSGVVNTTAPASSTVSNTADIDWDTLGDDAEGNQAAEATDVAQDDADFVVASPTFDKSILSTGINDSSNNDTQVVAGEFVTYQLVVTVPEGTTPLAEITDILDPDLIFDPTFAITAVGSSGVTFSGPATVPTVAGTNVSFDLGTIVNTDVDDAADDTVTITYRVYADADVVLGDVLPNDATLIWDGDNDGDNTDPEDGSLDDGTTVTVIAPELEIEKSITTVPNDAGDTIVYDVLIQHTAASNAGAMDVVFTDVLPSEIDAVSVTAVDSSGTAVSGFVINSGATQDTISNPDFNLALNDTVRLTITGIVNSTASASSTVLNTANISWDTLDDDAPADGFDNNPDPADNVEVGGSDSDDADFVVASPTFDKSILSTGINDSSNNDTQVVAGEFVTYQLVVTVPEGTTPLAEITDILDPNLIFDPTFAITSVGSSGVTFSGPATVPTVAGTNVTFDLGTIVNTDVDDAADDTVTITYRVYADSDVVLGDVLPNDATLIWDGDNDGDNTDPEDGSLDDGTTVTVIAPELEIEKSITTVPNDAGDTIVYDVLIQHTAASNAGAMDVVFTDVLPSEIDAVSVTAVDSSGTAVSGFVINSGATQDTISNPDFNLALNDTVRLTITGIVNSTASASSTVLNTANISWDTLDDDAPEDGFDNNPDPADNIEVGGSDSDDADFVVASPTFDKSILSTGINDSSNNDTQVVAGEFVTYQLVVTVPEGTTPLAEITDILDPNLIFDPTFAITSVGSSGVTFSGPATVPTVAGTNVTFDLGTIVNTDVDDAADDTVTITYRVYADADVVLGDVLPNDATLIWDGDNDGDNTDPEDGSLDDGTTVTVIGPELLVEKSVTQIPSDVGDPITYEIVIRHSVAADAPVMLSQTTAYDVTLSDNLPAGLTGLTIDSAVDSSGNPITGFNLAGNALSHAGFDLALGETITLTVSGIVGPTVVEGDTITNVADIDWTSLDDDSDDGNDAAETTESATDDADFTIGGITKSVLSTGINDTSNDNSEAVTGEYITYQLVVEIPQGASPVAEIEDTLDAGLVFDTANGVSVTPSSANLSTSLAPGDFSNTPFVYDSVTNTISIDLGDINNTAPVGTIENLTLQYRVYVADDALNAPEGATLNNTAEFKWDIDGDGSNDGPSDGTTQGSAPDVTVTEPELEIIKSTTTVPQDAGDTIVYDVLIQHTAGSTAGAMDVSFTDVLPSEIDAVSVTAVDSSGAVVSGFIIVPGATQDTISNPDFNLALDDTVRLTITGTVNTTVSASTTVLNTADITWDSLDDDAAEDGFDNNADPADNVQSGGTDTDDADFVVASPTFDKSILSTGINDSSNSDTQVVAGEFVTYQLVVTVPEGTTPLAEITDILDPDLIFDPTFAITAVGSSGVTFSGPATVPTVAGTNVSFDLGTIVNTDVDDTVDDTVTITYRVYADADVVLGDVLPNDATLIWDGDNDGDNTDPEDGSLDDGTTVTVIAPELEIEKSITTVPNDAGDTIVYDVLIQHTAASNAGAMDVVFTDVLPSEIDAVSVTAVDSSGTAVSGFVINSGATQDTISNPDFNLALNDTVRLTITGIVNSTASASSTVLNTANISWDTLDDDAPEDGFDNNPDPADNIEVGGSDSDDADFVVASPTFDKSILSTGINDSSNNDTQVVAGEFVTYQLVVTVPEGTTPLAEITDILDPDLIFDPTFAITAVGSSGVTFSGPATVPTVAGTNVSFDLGTIVNTDVDDTVDDTVTITYRVYADADVVLGDVLPNDATLIWDGDNDGDNTDPEDGSLDDGTTVTVIAPELELAKSITTVPNDAGDTIVYDILIAHTAVSNAGAMDIAFSDVLPSEIDAVSVTAVDSSGTAVSGFVINSGATQDTISNPDFNLALNDTVRLTITGIVNSTASASSTVLNTANISWDTLDDDAPEDGFDNNPDPADNIEVGGSDSDDADFVVASPTFDKSILSTGINDSSNNDTQVVAGEFVTYQLVVTVPEGTTPLAEITDILDPDLIFDPTFAITAVGSSGVTFSGPATVPTVAGTNVSFDLGTIVNTDVDDTVDDTVTITYRVYADADVVLGDVLPNDATLIWDADNDGDNTDPDDGSLDDGTTVTVIAPELELAKSITTVPNDAGDTIVYDILIAHTAVSNAGAMDIAFSDVLPSEIDAVSVTAVDSSGAAVSGFVIVSGATQDTISNPDFNLALNDTVRLTITGIVNSTASASTTVLNTANISWDTLDDDAPDDGFDNNPDPADNIEVGGSDSDDADFVVASPTFDKSILSTGISDATNSNTQVVAGEYVTYQLVVTVPEGTTPLAEITDVLDADLIFDPTFSITAVGSSGVTFSGPATAPTVAGSNVTFDLGTIINTDVDDALDDTVTITYRVYADADVVLGDVLPNDATLIWDADNDGDNTDSDDGSLNDGTTVTVIGPELLVEKSVMQIPSDIGDPITYEIVIRHTAAADAPLSLSQTTAYDVTLSDNLPAGLTGLTIDSAVDSGSNPVAGFTVVGNTLSHAGFDLALGETITLTISGIVGPTVVEGDTITNVADINWTSLDDDSDDGNDAAETTESATDDADFTIGGITKSVLSTGINDTSNDNSEAVTGEYITYQLVVEIPQGTTLVSEIEDSLDAGLVFDAANGITVTPSSANLTSTVAPGDFSGIAATYDAITNLISIPLGDVTNTAPVGTIESLTLTYRVYVDNDNINAPVGANLNNTVDYKWDIDGDGSNDGPTDGTTEAMAPDIEVIAPELEVNKHLIVTPVDAGDTVTYEITIEHTANSLAAAFDTSFSDQIPSEISSVSIVSVVDSNANAVAGFGISGNTVSNPDFDLALGDSIVITVTGVVNSTASASTTITNTANITWDTLGDDAQGNQSVEDGGGDQSSDDFVVASPTLDKLIVSTGIDDATNNNTQVVAGEFVVYSLVVTVPEGTTPLAEITDTLNPDLIFDPSYPISVTPSSGVSFSGPATTPAVSGNTVHFDLGTVVNANTDDTVADTVTVTYRVYTDIDVVLGDVLDNSATFIWDADNDGDNTDSNDGSLSDQTTVTTLVPELVIEKSVTQVPADVGDTIEYTFVIRHTDPSDTPLNVSNATAYDISFSDSLPNGIVNAAVLSAVDSSGGNVAGFTISNTAAGSSVNNASFDLAVGETVTVTVIAEMSNAIVEGDTIVNTASVNWGTLDADSDDGFDAGEAISNDSDSAGFSIANVEKSVVGTGINDAFNDNAEAVAGEFIHYQVVVEVPQGNSPLAELVDVLDAGLIFDAANGVSVTPSSANLSSSVAPGDFSLMPTSYDQTINTLSVELGDIVNTAPAGVVETLTLNYRVYVANDSVSAPTGAALNNSVDFRWDIDGDGSNNGPLDGTTEDAANPINVITPELEVIKDIINMPSETGDLITYQFTVQHTGNSQTSAYDVSFVDALPLGINGVVINSVSSTGAPVSGFTVAGNTVSNSSFDLAFGDSVTVLVSGFIDASVDAGDTIPNTAAITWSTLDAANGSDGADIFDPTADGSGEDTDTESFSIADIHKSIVDTGINNGANSDGEVVNGEYITYQVVVDIPQGSTPVAQITDSLDSGLTFDSLISVVPTTSALSTNIGAGDFSDIVAPAQGSTGNISFTLGDIVNTNNSNAVTESLILTYQVYVTNANVVSAGAQLNNSVQLAYDINGDGQNNGPGDGSTAAAAPNVTVLEPQLIVSKAVDDTVPHLGQTITYTVVVTNQSVPFGTDAMDVSVSDNLPAGMSFHPGSITVNGNSVIGLSGVANNSVGNNLNLTLDKVEFATSTVITYQATVSSDTADFGASLANTVNIDWSSLSSKDNDDGIDGEERDNSDGYTSSANEAITLTAPDYTISKSSSNNGPLRAGDAFSYTVTVSNVGSHEGTGVVVSDQFPVSALDSPNAISGGGVFDENTGLITWNIAELAVNETVSFTVDVAVLESLSPDLDGNGDSLSDTFTNTASVTDDGLNGLDPNPGNNDASDSDEIIATPDYSISKTNNIEMAAPLSQFTYVIEADNHGTQAGTGVVIVDTYPTDILAVIDADGGTIDATAGTITWQYPIMNVGDSVLFNVVMEVLPTANLDTPDQLFHNSVSVTDDGKNGPDGTPEDNSDSHSDMLLAGGVEPMALMALMAPPESVNSTSEWLDVVSNNREERLLPPSVNEPRFITSQSMLSGNQSVGLFSDDVLRGGSLLDTFSLDKLEPSEECAVHYTRADVSPEELLSGDSPAGDTNPWGWLEDLPEANQSANQATNAVTSGQTEKSAPDVLESDALMLKDNTISLPMTSLNGAQSLFNIADSVLQVALTELPDNDLSDSASASSIQLDTKQGS